VNQRNIYKLPEKEKAQTPTWVRAGFRSGVGLILLGLVVVGIAGASVLSAITRGAHQINFPGSANLKLKSGLYVGIPVPPSPPSDTGLFVTVTEQATGESVPVQMGSDMTVAVAGPQGGSPLFQFETYDAGTYVVSGTASTLGGNLSIMLVHESLGRTRSDLVVGALAGALLVLTGILLIWYTAKKKRELFKENIVDPTAGKSV
jgi:hypothetical protein